MMDGFCDLLSQVYKYSVPDGEGWIEQVSAVEETLPQGSP
jgi:hypothetical protein